MRQFLSNFLLRFLRFFIIVIGVKRAVLTMCRVRRERNLIQKTKLSLVSSAVSSVNRFNSFSSTFASHFTCVSRSSLSFESVYGISRRHCVNMNRKKFSLLFHNIIFQSISIHSYNWLMLDWKLFFRAHTRKNKKKKLLSAEFLEDVDIFFLGKIQSSAGGVVVSYWDFLRIIVKKLFNIIMEFFISHILSFASSSPANTHSLPLENVEKVSPFNIIYNQSLSHT